VHRTGLCELTSEIPLEETRRTIRANDILFNECYIYIGDEIEYGIGIVFSFFVHLSSSLRMADIYFKSAEVISFIPRKYFCDNNSRKIINNKEITFQN